jgi:hypothetical protein
VSAGRAIAWAAGVLTAVLLRETADALQRLADRVDAATGQETADHCPDYVPDALLEDQ